MFLAGATVPSVLKHIGLKHIAFAFHYKSCHSWNGRRPERCVAFSWLPWSFA